MFLESRNTSIFRVITLLSSLAFGGCTTTQPGSEAYKWAEDVIGAVKEACSIVPDLLDVVVLFEKGAIPIKTAVDDICGAAGKAKATATQAMARTNAATPSIAGTRLKFTVNGVTLHASSM